MLARRLVRAFAAAAVAASVVVGSIVLLLSHKIDPRALERATVERRAAIERCAASAFDPPLGGLPAADRRDFCAEALPAPPFTFRLTGLLDILVGAGLKGTSLPLVVLGALLGASVVGAEWSSGSIFTLLTWEPRRIRVALAKVSTCAAAVFAGALLLQTTLGVSLVPAALLRGSTAGVDAAWLGDVVGVAVRVSGVAALGAAIGGAAALIGRSTAAVLGAGLIYALVEVVVRSFENPAWQRWLLGDVAGVLILGKGSSGRSVLDAAMLLAAFTTALLLLAIGTFRTRDAP
jgi:hypothetical protein